MGARGPVPKRDNQRRRRNEPEGGRATRALGAEVVEVPPAGEWTPAVVRWYESLARSGQSAFYEPSDWSTAYLLAEAMHLELTKGEPPSAASMASWWKAMAALMVTEGDRRRMRLELERPQPAEEAADVSELAEYRRRLQSG